MKIFVISHKKVELNIPNDYQILSVGKYDGKIDSFLSDQDLESISEKNKSYCELTGHYWIWKNTNYNIVGLVHYRRFFYKGSNLINNELISKNLNKYDIILPNKSYLRETNYSHYIKEDGGCGYEHDLKLLREIVLEKYPEYISCYDKYFNSKKTYYYNMLICKKDLFDNYSKFLFDILFELENRVSIENYDDYHKRIFGFISERLLNIYVMHNKLNIKEYPVYMPDTSKFNRIKIRLKNFIKKLLP